MMQSARMQKTKNPPALAVMTRRLMEGGGLRSEVELSFTALKSVTPGRNNDKYITSQANTFNRIKYNLLVALSP